jgi:hypothetical protein
MSSKPASYFLYSIDEFGTGIHVFKGGVNGTVLDWAKHYRAH